MRRLVRHLFTLYSAVGPRAALLQAVWCAGAVFFAAAMAFSYTHEEYFPYYVGGYQSAGANVSLGEGRLAVLVRGRSTQVFYERTVVRVPGVFVGTRHPWLASNSLDTESGADVHLAWPLALCTAGFVASVALRRRHATRGCCPACGYDLRATPGRCPECGTAAPAGLTSAPAGAAGGTS
jgi:hypothetical protein